MSNSSVNREWTCSTSFARCPCSALDNGCSIRFPILESTESKKLGRNSVFLKLSHSTKTVESFWVIFGISSSMSAISTMGPDQYKSLISLCVTRSPVWVSLTTDYSILLLVPGGWLSALQLSNMFLIWHLSNMFCGYNIQVQGYDVAWVRYWGWGPSCPRR